MNSRIASTKRDPRPCPHCNYEYNVYNNESTLEEAKEWEKEIHQGEDNYKEVSERE